MLSTICLLAVTPTVPFVLRNPVSSAAHFMWCLFTLFAGLFLVRLARNNRLKAISLGIFAASMVLLYFASGLYHALQVSDETLRYFKLIDHSAIYLLIAGSYTPVIVVVLRGQARVLLLSIIWGLALLGIASKWLLPLPPYQLTVGIYIAMGWVGVLQLGALWRGLGRGGFLLALLGGVFYTIGGVSDALGWPELLPGIFGPHEVLHFSDMIGTTIHIAMMMLYVIPRPVLV